MISSKRKVKIAAILCFCIALCVAALSFGGNTSFAGVAPEPELLADGTSSTMSYENGVYDNTRRQGEFLTTEIPEGADGGVLKIRINEWSRGWFKINFTNPVNVDDIGSLTFKTYFHIGPKNDDTVISVNNFAYGLFRMDATQSDLNVNSTVVSNAANGVLLSNIKYSEQDAWVDINVGLSDLLKLADAEGNISGFMFWSETVSDSPTNNLIYANWNPYMLIDSIICNEAVPVDESIITDGTSATMAYENGLYGNTRRTGEFLTTEIPEGADGGVLKIKIVEWARGWVRLNFLRPVSVESLAGIRLKTYFHIGPKSDDTLINSTNFAYGLFPADATQTDLNVNYSDVKSAPNGVLLNNIKYSEQDKWINININAQDIARLADSNGELSGLTLWCETISDSPTNALIYAGWAPYMLIDDITCIQTQAPSLPILSDGSLETTEIKYGVKGTDKVLGGAFEHFMWAASVEGVLPEGADGAVIKLPVHHSNLCLVKINFKNKVLLSEIDMLTFKMCFHISDAVGEEALPGNYGFFAPTSEMKAADEVRIAGLKNSEQDKWVDVCFVGDDLTKLADSDGYISGVNFYVNTNSQTGIYQNQQAYILIDEVRGENVYTVTFKNGTDEKNANVVVNGKAKKPVTPEKNGYVFTGWKKEDGNLFDFGSSVVEDIILTASWLQSVATPENCFGLYYSTTEGYIALNTDGTVSFDTASVITYAFAAAADGNIYIDSNYGTAVLVLENNGSITIGEENYAKAEYLTVIYHFMDGDVEKYIPASTKAPALSFNKDGYTFIGWYLNDATQAFDFDTELTADTELYLKWGYVEIADYSHYYSEFYDSESGMLIRLSENNALTLIDGEDEEKFDYYILETGKLFVEDGLNKETDISVSQIIYKGNTFSKLGRYYVVFQTSGGEIYAEQTTEKGKAEKLLALEENPEKEGFIFEGWFTSDGKAAEFDKIIKSSSTYHAKWSKVVDDTTEQTQNKGCLSSVKGEVVIVLCLIVGIVISKRKRRT